MKRYSKNLVQLLLILCFGTMSFLLQAQNPSAIMDLESTTQGVLIPRMTSIERNAINSPAQSLLVYDTDTESFYYFENGIWNELGAGGAGGTTDEISDADNNTKIQVEESPNEDIIRFDLAGDEQFVFRNNTNGVQRIGLTSTHNNSLFGQFAGNQINPTGTGSEGTLNTIIGSFAGIQLSTGHSNTFVGQASGNSATGSRNTMIGRAAGSNNTGSGNVFIGHNAGNAATGSDKLYIDNTNTNSPLIYGEFNNNLVRVNGDAEIDGDLKLGTWNNGSSGNDSTQLLLSGAFNAGPNNGSTTGTYKLKIEGYQNDGGIVYPIYVSDENSKIDFYLKNRQTASDIPQMFFGGDVYMGDEDDSDTRMEWRINRGTLLAGRADGTQWDNVGLYSFISGRNNSAPGDVSIVSGLNNIVSNQSCAVFGENNNVSGLRSIVAGLHNIASNQSTAVFGENNNVSGIASIVSGLFNTASNQSCAVFGERNSASGYASAALGRFNIVEGQYGLSAGGTRLRVKSYSEVAIGRYNDTLATNSPGSWDADDILFAAGNGSSNTDRNNAFTIMKNGEAHFHKQDEKADAILIAHRDGPKYGGGGTFVFGTDKGFVLEHQDGTNNFESSGIYGDGNSVFIWSPGDNNRLLSVHDEDEMTSGTSEKWYIDDTGTPSSFVPNPNETSARALPKLNALQKLKTLKASRYTLVSHQMKDNKRRKEERTHLHLDPSSLARVLPELVDTKDNGQQFIKYNGVIVVLTEAVKEQQDLIEQLTLKNEALANENQIMNTRLEQIEEKLKDL